MICADTTLHIGIILINRYRPSGMCLKYPVVIEPIYISSKKQRIYVGIILMNCFVYQGDGVWFFEFCINGNGNS